MDTCSLLVLVALTAVAISGLVGVFSTLLELMELAVKTAESEDVVLMQYVLLFGFFSSQS